MTKFLRAITLAFVATAAYADPALTPSISEVRQTLTRLYPATRIDAIRDTPIAGLYQLTMGSNVAYVDASGRYFLFGHMYDMPANKDLTADVLPASSDRDGNPPTRIEISILLKEDSFIWQAGTGPTEVMLFSDPNCSYCRRIEATLSSMPDVTVRLYPVAMLGGSADAVAATWCSPDRAGTWKAIVKSPRSAISAGRPAQCDVSVIERNRQLGQRIGLRGTPTLVGPDGRVLVGNSDANSLRRWLAQTSTAMQARTETR